MRGFYLLLVVNGLALELLPVRFGPVNGERRIECIGASKSLWKYIDHFGFAEQSGFNSTKKEKSS
jgi:hypothetical protein